MAPKMSRSTESEVVADLARVRIACSHRMSQMHHTTLNVGLARKCTVFAPLDQGFKARVRRVVVECVAAEKRVRKEFDVARELGSPPRSALSCRHSICSESRPLPSDSPSVPSRPLFASWRPTTRQEAGSVLVAPLHCSPLACGTTSPASFRQMSADEAFAKLRVQPSCRRSVRCVSGQQRTPNQASTQGSP